MLTSRDRLLFRIKSQITVDKTDSTAIRINYDYVLRLLGENKFPIRPATFEKALSKIFDEQFVGKLPAEPTIAQELIAQTILDLAQRMFPQVTI